MYKDVLRSIEGVGIYPAISLIIFLTIFVGMVIWAVSLNREYISEMGQLPLEDDQSTNATKEGVTPHVGA